MRRPPDSRTRVNLTPPPEVLAVLDRMSKASGVGKATIITQWLSESLPQLHSLASAMEQASRGNVDAFTTMIAALQEAASESKQLELEVRSQRRAVMRKRSKPRD